jgi:hypothetical protein
LYVKQKKEEESITLSLFIQVITWIDKRELGKETANYFYIKRRNIYSNSEQSLITLKKNNRGKTEKTAFHQI